MVIEKEHPKGKLEKQTIHTGHLFTSLAFQKKGLWLTMISLTADWFGFFLILYVLRQTAVPGAENHVGCCLVSCIER